MRTTQTIENEEVPLLRGGQIVTSLLGSFGRGLRETRLTACLGYLIAREPESFRELLGLRGKIQSVSVEHRNNMKRTNVQIATSHGTTVLEAKVGSSDGVAQLLGYDAKCRVLVTPFPPTSNERARRNLRFVTWQQVASVLQKIARRPSSASKPIAVDLLDYLKEHQMIKGRDAVEIYAREINEPTSLLMFLQAAIFGCENSKGSKVGEALYFAPHFGKKLRRTYPGTHWGISYIAKIEHVEPTSCWDDFKQVIFRHRGRAWFNKNEDVFKAVKWLRLRKEHLILVLSRPRLVFTPPIRKDTLQDGSGWLSKRYFMFQEFFDVWGT